MNKESKLEITKILAKVMQSSYKRKELGEIVLRILNKLEKTMEGSKKDLEYEKLKEEFLEIQKEIG